MMYSFTPALLLSARICLLKVLLLAPISSSINRRALISAAGTSQSLSLLVIIESLRATITYTKEYSFSFGPTWNGHFSGRQIRFLIWQISFSFVPFYLVSICNQEHQSFLSLMVVFAISGQVLVIRFFLVFKIITAHNLIHSLAISFGTAPEGLNGEGECVVISFGALYQAICR